jgi:hypothetical protein
VPPGLLLGKDEGGTLKPVFGFGGVCEVQLVQHPQAEVLLTQSFCLSVPPHVPTHTPVLVCYIVCRNPLGLFPVSLWESWEDFS